METLLHRLLATWTKSQEGSPRRSPSATVRCESLEGRQLLSTMSLLRGNVTQPLSPGAQRVQFSTRGSSAGQNAGGLGNGSVAPQSFTHAGQFGNHGAFVGGANGGGLGARKGLASHAMYQGANSVPATLAVNTTAVPNAPSLRQETVATDTTTAPADPANAVATVTNTAPADPADAVTTATNVDGSAPAAGVVNSAVQGGPAGGWVGWSRTNQPVMFHSTLAQSADGSGAQGGNASSIAAPSAAEKTAFEKLHTDIQTIHDKSEVTPKLLAAVRKDFEAIQKGAKSDPDQAALDTLATDVKGIAGKLPTDAQRAQLVTDFTAVLKSQGITDQTLIDKAIADIQAVVTASNVTGDDLATIAADREAIKTAVGSDAGATSTAPTLAADPVGSLFAGLTGGFESEVPTVHPYVGAAMGGGFDASQGPISYGGGVPDGQSQTLPAMDGQFHTLPAIVSPAGAAAGSQLQTSRAAADKGMGGHFSGAPTTVSYAGGGMSQRFGTKIGGGMGGQFGGPGASSSLAKGRSSQV